MFDSAINSLALRCSARLLAESFYDIYRGKIISSAGKTGGASTNHMIQNAPFMPHWAIRGKQMSRHRMSQRPIGCAMSRNYPAPVISQQSRIHPYVNHVPSPCRGSRRERLPLWLQASGSVKRKILLHNIFLQTTRKLCIMNHNVRASAAR
jgi:hypothetical protein